MSNLHPVDLTQTYYQLKPSGESFTWDANEFWRAVQSGQKFDTPFGFLVSQYEFSESWANWECHPEGDELLIAVEGCMEMLLELDGKQTKIFLAAPNSFLVPKGAWHTAEVKVKCKIIGVTAGEGTQHRPR